MTPVAGAGAIRSLLVVTHEATLTGAPMNLLHLLRWMHDNTSIRLHVVVGRDGPLRHRFEQLAPVTVLDDDPATAALSVAQRGLEHLGSRRASRAVAAVRLHPQLRRLRGFDAVYLNSLESLGLLPYLPDDLPSICHVHELQVALRTSPQRVQELLRSGPALWVAASGAVRDLLVSEVGLPPNRVLLHHEFIDVNPFAERRSDLRAIERLRRSLLIPADAAVVMGAGTIDWRKGPDLFIQLAAEVRRRTRAPYSFLWVGGDLVGTDMARLRADMERAGTPNVTFVGTKPDPLPFFELADVFALTSREDPYPLVCLEHAAMGHPIVTYRNGGIVELLEAAGPEAAAGVVDHLDVRGLADRVVALCESDRLYRAAGDQLRRRVLGAHDVSVAAPRLLADIEAHLGDHR